MTTPEPAGFPIDKAALLAWGRSAAGRAVRWREWARRGPATDLTRWLFLRGLALIYMIAFASLGVQILGLVGSDGILPAAEFLESVSGNVTGADRFFKLPTLFWWGASDGVLQAACWAGVGIAGLAFANLLPGACFLLLWLLYLSFFQITGVFLGFQWDILLLEAGFLALFLAPWGLRPRWRV